MAKKKAEQETSSEPVAQEGSSRDPAENVVDWFQKNQRLVTGALTAAIVIVAGIWFVRAYDVRKENAAQRDLQGARSSVAVGNLPLAANDLSRVVNAYSGTRGAQEAAVLLGHVRLLQDQVPQAITGLREFLDDSPDAVFRVQALGLLGLALEEAGQMAEAAEAFEDAASDARFDYQKAGYLLDAARAHTAAGDSAAAREAYTRIVSDFPEDLSATEARMRLAEMDAAQA